MSVKFRIGRASHRYKNESRQCRGKVGTLVDDVALMHDM